MEAFLTLLCLGLMSSVCLGTPSDHRYNRLAIERILKHRNRAYESELEHVHRNDRNYAKRTLAECDTPLEIVFVLDESGSIWGPDFESQLDFVKDIIDNFNVGPDTTHIGVMTFATDTNIIMTLGEYANDKPKMKEIIGEITQRRGNTHTERALDILRRTMFSRQYARKGIPYIGIVITDGVSEFMDDTKEAADKVKAEGITMFAIGVGRKVNEEELLNIASDPEFMFQVESYDELMEKLETLLPEAACKVTTLPPTTTTTTTTTTTPIPTTLPQMVEGCDGSNPLDVLFAVPDEAGIRNTDLALDFIQDVVQGFKIGSERVQVGLTPRLCGDLDSIDLNENDEKEPLLYDIGNRGLQDTMLSLQLEYLLAEGFTIERGDRSSAKDVAILIVDNEASSRDDVLSLAREAKEDNIKLIVIGVGDYVDKALLEEVATSPRHAFFVDQYGDLADLTESIHDTLCREASL